MACKPKRAFAGGGAVGADGLTDEQRAKLAGARASLGVSNSPPVAQQPAPAPQPAPQTQQPQGISSGLGIVGLLKNRGAQIDKSAGYANGGKIKGIGTPTSDSIPAKVQETGEQIKVSTTERILSADQDAMLESMARKSGFDSLDAMLEAGTGKPVGPTIKGGKKAAAGGWNIDNNPDEYAKAMQEQVLGRTAQINAPSFSVGAGQAPTIYDNGGLPTATDRVSGSLPVAKQPAASPLVDGIRPWYAGASTADSRTGLEMERERRAGALSAGAIGDPVKSALQFGVIGGESAQPAIAKTSATTGSSVSGLPQASYSNEGRSVPSAVAKPGAGIVVDNEFTQGGKSYTASPSSQQGIARVTAPGTSPLYTNIDPAQGVAGLKNQTIGQPADQESQGIARIANANKIRGEMIANRDKDIPAGGYAPGILGNGILGTLPGGQSIEEWNRNVGVKTQLGLDPKSSAAYEDQAAKNEIHRQGQELAGETSRQNAGLAAQAANNRDQVTMRGQDLNAQNEAARIAGNPLDNQTKQLSLTQAQRLGILQDSVLNGKTPEEQASAAAKIRALSGKQDREDRTVKPMEIADPNDPMGQRKILVRPNDDGTYTPMQPHRTYAEFAQAYLSKKPGTKPEQMKADYEQLYGSR